MTAVGNIFSPQQFHCIAFIIPCGIWLRLLPAVVSLTLVSPHPLHHIHNEAYKVQIWLSFLDLKFYSGLPIIQQVKMYTLQGGIQGRSWFDPWLICPALFYTALLYILWPKVGREHSRQREQHVQRHSCMEWPGLFQLQQVHLYWET